MRPRLQRLLAAAEVPADAVANWERVLVVNSYGSLSPGVVNRERHIWNRALQLVLVSATGQPTHYCKFRIVRPDGIQHRESVILERFSRHPGSSAVVPRTTTAQDERMGVQVARFVPGVRMDEFLTSLTPDEVTASTSWALAGATVLANMATEMPDVFPRLGGSVNLEEESKVPLELLARIDVPEWAGVTVRHALRLAGDVPAVAQHRDLWPKNIIRDSNGACRIVDFDDYGAVVVPLYDAAHLVRSVDEILHPRDTTPWLLRLSADGARSSAMRSIIRAESEKQALSGIQSIGCLLFYLLDIPASLFLRETTPVFWGRFRDELTLAAALLRESPSLEALSERLIFRP